MRKTRKMLSMLLALVMVFALATTALATEGEEPDATSTTPPTYTITAPDNGHTYEVYQIFTGDLSEGVLSNVKWGKNGTGTQGEAVSDVILAELEGTSGGDTAKLAVITKYVDLDSEEYGTATNAAPLENVPAGYYLIKDVDGALEGEEDSYTLYIVKIVKDVTISPKANVPTVQKKVKDTNDSTGETSGWQDSADYDIGDVISYQLTATLANNVSSYVDDYKLVFTDTLSKGLSYGTITSVYIEYKDGETNKTINISVKTESAAGYVANTTSYTGNEDGDAYVGGTVLTVTIDDVKACLPEGAETSILNSAKVIVEYTATLNENAKIGSAGNPNKVDLTYSNNPNWSGDGAPETGKTPEDTVIVFTYKTIINKVEPYTEVLNETEYNELDEETQKLYTEAENEDGSVTYTRATTRALTGAEFTLEKYNKESSKWEAIDAVKNAEGTTFTFSGLDDGNYRLTETKTPAGYNSIDPIEFTVTAEHDVLSDNPALTSLSGNATTGELTFTSNTTAGSLSADVVNQAGSTLPETGGIGTTIFYVLGSVLVIGAAVLLVTKKRMSDNA